MTQVLATPILPVNFVQHAQQNPMEFLNSIDQMLENFGAESVGTAAAQKFLGIFAEGLKEMINNSDLPEGIKQMAVAMIDQHLSDMGISPSEVSDAVDNSDLGSDVEDDANDALGCCCADKPAASPMADEASAEAANETIYPTTVSTEPPMSEAAAAAKNAEVAYEATDQTDADAALDSLMGFGETEEDKKKKGASGNFLEALALVMGTVQGEMLNRAKGYSDQMKEFSGNEEKAQDFTIAQAKYSATMQMFNIYSSQVGTSLKTVGEAMSGIARKQ